MTSKLDYAKKKVEYSHINATCFDSSNAIENKIDDLQNIRFKTPVGFIYKAHIVQCKTWKGMYVALVKILCHENVHKVKNFYIRRPTRDGGVKKYSYKNYYYPIKIFGTNLTIETNRSAADLVKKMSGLLENFSISNQVNFYIKKVED